MENLRLFSSAEIYDRDDLINETLEVVRLSDLKLGDASSQKNNKSRTKEAFSAKLSALALETASFSPKLVVTEISEADFRRQGIEPSWDMQMKFKDYRFLQVTVPITLFPKAGWAFTRLECWIEFCQDETNNQNKPIIYDLFPEDQWKDILSFTDGFKLGIDAGMHFKAQSEKLSLNTEEFNGEASGGFGIDSGINSKLVVGPFLYNIRRPIVMARGRLNVQAFWRLDGNGYVGNEDVLLGLILMVPKNRRKEINAIGELRAYHDFQTWSADLIRDWGANLTEVIKSFFKSGAFIYDKKIWDKIG